MCAYVCMCVHMCAVHKCSRTAGASVCDVVFRCFLHVCVVFWCYSRVVGGVFRCFLHVCVVFWCFSHVCDECLGVVDEVCASLCHVSLLSTAGLSTVLICSMRIGFIVLCMIGLYHCETYSDASGDRRARSSRGAGSSSREAGEAGERGWPPW